MSKRSKKSNSPSNAQRLTIGGTAGVVIVAIVLVAQYVFGIDLLNVDQTAVPTSPQVTTVAPTPAGTGVAEVPAGELKAIPGGYDGGWFQLYFTQPINTTDESQFHGSPVEDALVQDINSAQSTIDVAVFELNSQPVTDALIKAEKNGVDVRVVTDGDHGLENPTTTIDQLEAAGIPVVSDGTRNGFMHNKFFVIDGLHVWTGSTNITQNGFYNNNNNSIYIRSTQLADNFTQEFDELFAGQFGKTSPNTVPNPDLTINNTEIETIFESEGDAPTRLVQLINQAHSVRFLAFSLTRADMIDAMLNDVQSNGLDLKGIVEASQRSYAKKLFCAGLQVRQDGNPDILHDKVFIFDESIVVTGSFNFSQSAANDNDENVLIIHNSAIANAYIEEFNKRWAEAKTVSDADMGC